MYTFSLGRDLVNNSCSELNLFYSTSLLFQHSMFKALMLATKKYCNQKVIIIGIYHTVYRFFNLLTAMHFNDNTNHVPRGQEGWDPLFKLRPFLEHLCAAFQLAYVPEQDITIDKGMAGWRGCLSFKVS